MNFSSLFQSKFVNRAGAGRAEAITAAPAKVSGVYPADAATNLQLDTVITWDRPAMAQWYDVYLSTNPLDMGEPVSSHQLQRSYSPPGLTLDTTYYLQINAGNSIDVTPGDVTSFSTWASAGILLDENDNPITDENGEYIETE